MKEFLHNYGYSSVKMFVNQFAISLFGAVLSMATTMAKSDILAIITSILAILFYLFLVYALMWEVGAKDRISVDIGKKQYRPHTGLAVAAVASIPSLLIAIVYSIGYPFSAAHEWAGGLCVVASFFNMLLQGMYFGLTSSISFLGSTLNLFWLTHFVIIIPALVTAWVAYYLGHKNKKFTTLFNYQSPDKAKKK
ncbi:MAG: hypothetical protein J6A83_05935 [Clostridia bacterium]|nr:hypothetical protein [Clostridia bacterium]